ncbi:hypothetical protein ACIGDM_13225 [Rothia koreensis]|uniref:hypothetical protein n=1 Tax=Rothia koreensis TaxID=592378 RepID=UPI0037C67D71
MNQENNTEQTRFGSRFRLSRRGWGGLIAAVVAILLAVAVLVGLSIGKHSANQDTDGGEKTSASASPSWAADKDKRAKKVATKFTNIWFAEIEPINPSYTYDQWRQDITQYMTAELSNQKQDPSRTGDKATSVTQRKVEDSSTAVYTVRLEKGDSWDLTITDDEGDLKIDSIQPSSLTHD